MHIEWISGLVSTPEVLRALELSLTVGMDHPHKEARVGQGKRVWGKGMMDPCNN